MNNKFIRSFVIILVTAIIGVGGFTFFKSSEKEPFETHQISAKKKTPKKAKVVQTKDVKSKKATVKSNEVVKPTDNDEETYSETNANEFEETGSETNANEFEETGSETNVETTASTQTVSSDFVAALEAANIYAGELNMSRQAIYEQLISEYGEGFSPAAAQYAIDNMTVNYSNNALESAKIYQNEMNMSPEEIHDQLTSEYGEQFNSAEADYAINNL